jgi:heme oxygenase (biliverdin-IX-beta and delta-forming)
VTTRSPAEEPRTLVAAGALADFTGYALRVERVRWVGGYGRMGSADGADYHAAEPDPVAPGAAGAIAHLNADHADALLDMARALADHADATGASCLRIDRYGLDLAIATPGGPVEERIAFAEPARAPGGLRAATVELARRARGATS